MIPALLGLAGVQAGIGLLKDLKAQSELKKLNRQPIPEFYETPEQKASRLRAGAMSKSGFTPEENAAYQQQYSRSQNTAYQRGLDVAPNMASSLLAGLNYTNIGAINSHAAADANLHRNNIRYHDAFNEKLQSIADRNIATQIQARNDAYRQLGLGAQSGLNMLGSGLNLGAIGLLSDGTATGVGATDGLGVGGSNNGAGLGMNTVNGKFNFGGGYGSNTGLSNSPIDLVDPLYALRVRAASKKGLTGY